jgi:DNA-directed RNA polymerase I, II, and III subunit RPABC1
MNAQVGGLTADASRLYRVRKTCLKMLAKRGYIVDEAEIGMTTDDFRIKFGEQPSRDR